MKITILLADDHRMIREGLRALLEREDDMKVVAEANDGRAAVELARKHKPSVAVLDLAMPDLNGIDAARQIVAASPRTRVIILSVHADRRFVTASLRAGAAGYVLKDSAFEELAHAVRVAAAGQTYLSPAVARTVVEDYLGRSPRRRSSAFVVLTDRERQVLQLLAEGRSAKQHRHGPRRQHQDRRDAPREHHEEARQAQHRRADQVRHPRRSHAAVDAAG